MENRKKYTVIEKETGEPIGEVLNHSGVISTTVFVAPLDDEEKKQLVMDYAADILCNSNHNFMDSFSYEGVEYCFRAVASKMTYRDLMDELEKLSDEQLDMDISVLQNDQEYMEAGFIINYEDDVINDGHPVIVVV